MMVACLYGCLHSLSSQGQTGGEPSCVPEAWQKKEIALWHKASSKSSTWCLLFSQSQGKRETVVTKCKPKAMRKLDY